MARSKQRRIVWLSRTDRRGPDECWPWVGKCDRNGYGHCKAEGRFFFAHRIAFEVANGTEPVGVVRHSCDNPGCQNGKHLIDGTQAENVADRDARGRTAMRERNGRTKLSTRQVVWAREQHARGRSLRSLARELGVHHATATRAVQGATWRSVA